MACVKELQEIPSENWLELRDLYKKDWPYFIYFYNLVDHSYKWKMEHGYEIQLFSCGGNWRLDGTFISIYKPLNFICMGSLDRTNKQLEMGLRETKLINWNDKVYFNFLHKNQYDLIFEIPREKGLQLNYFIHSTYWWLPREKALEFDEIAPEGTYFDKLSEEHAKQIFSVYPHKNECPYLYVENMLKYNGGCGVFSKDDKSLLTWITLSDVGCMAILQTMDGHQGKGYGKTLTKKWCRILADMGITPVLFTVVGNKAGESLFQKIGFQIISYSTWTQTSPFTE